MTIGIIATAEQKAALQAQGFAADVRIEWMDHPYSLPDAVAIIDFLNLQDSYPAGWTDNSSTPLFINKVEDVIENPPPHFIRFNGWPGFWERPILEASCTATEIQTKAEQVMALFGKKISWVNDLPGFLTARVIAGIINEAYLTLGEGVSTKEAIDTAMKLGTNYPYGPFEWTEKIGADRIVKLLTCLAKAAPQYQPAPLLLNEAEN